MMEVFSFVDIFSQVNMRRHEAGQAQKYAVEQQAKRAALLRAGGGVGACRVRDYGVGPGAICQGLAYCKFNTPMSIYLFLICWPRD